MDGSNLPLDTSIDIPPHLTFLHNVTGESIILILYQMLFFWLSFIALPLNLAISIISIISVSISNKHHERTISINIHTEIRRYFTNKDLSSQINQLEHGWNKTKQNNKKKWFQRRKQKERETLVYQRTRGTISSSSKNSSPIKKYLWLSKESLGEYFKARLQIRENNIKYLNSKRLIRKRQANQ